jgi:hypothetical protein
VDYLDIRDAAVLMWLPLVWYSRMLEAHADFLEQIIVDSTLSVELRLPVTEIYAPERDNARSTLSLQ